jgi:hypothetical protein
MSWLGQRLLLTSMSCTACSADSSAHLLLQIRARVSNGDWEATFREWYLRFRASPQQVAA